VRSDIYSLGATLYHLLTNQPPVNAKSRFLQPQSFEPPSQLNPDISPAVERAILHAISMHPDDRPGSVGALRAELFSSQPLPLVSNHTEGARASVWARAARDNLAFFLIMVVLLVVALVATILSPYLPPYP
jgi:serine/threonine-protein kinase